MQFVRDPMNYFSSVASPSETEPGSRSIPILYNFLAMDVAGADQAGAEDFTFTPLTDACFRSADSLRGHAVELLVTDHHGGLALTWRVDETIAEEIGLHNWIERCRSTLNDPLDTPDHSMATVHSRDFPDSGLDESELSDFLDSLD